MCVTEYPKLKFSPFMDERPFIQTSRDGKQSLHMYVVTAVKTECVLLLEFVLLLECVPIGNAVSASHEAKHYAF